MWVHMESQAYNGELDHSAKYYPIITRKDAQSIFCVQASLEKKIDIANLQEALSKTLKFYPTFSVALTRGYSWHKFKHNDRDLPISNFNENIMVPIKDIENNGHQMRVSIKDNVLRLEIFHGVTDANIGFEFLSCLIKTYNAIQKGEGFSSEIYDQPEDYENSFRVHAKKEKSNMKLTSLLEKDVAVIKGDLIEELGAKQHIENFSVSDLLPLAKKRQVSLSALIIGILVKASFEFAERDKKVVIMVPVDLRRMFNSISKRNFVSFVRLRYFDRTLDLEGLIKQTNKMLKEQVNKEYFEEFMSLTDKATRGIVSYLPLWFKEMVIKPIVKRAKTKHTIIFSNIGKLADIEGVKNYTLNLNISKNNPINFGMVTVNGVISIGATSKIKNIEVIKYVFDTINKMIKEDKNEQNNVK